MKKPSPPAEARDGPPRPGPKISAENGEDAVVIPGETFRRILKQIRTNELLGAAAADALEEAAGLRDSAGAQGQKASELRSKVAEVREDEGAPKAKKKGPCFGAEAEEIPDAPAPPPKSEKKRASISNDESGHDAEAIAQHVAKDAEEPPELNLNPKQNHLRTNLEMWVMDEIPVLFGVDDSDELDESLQEDAQAFKITELIAETEAPKQNALLEAWLSSCTDEDARTEFSNTILQKVSEIQDAGPKKKKKKKKG